ncbi:hypothetical protein T12_8759 [Trichinella patagoniensis]|uniref:Uncharacterized protein n=1 Tax=Trichinella patagoniensis TaxID=990121 RepID=A0A0V1AAL5_9BILA|nr:hypothetical protein T12_8759 [Trichinella patagoniensis]
MLVDTEMLNAVGNVLCHSMKRKHSYQFKIRSFDTSLMDNYAIVCYDAGGKNLGLGKDFANKFYNSNLVALSTAITDGKSGCSTRGKSIVMAARDAVCLIILIARCQQCIGEPW